MIYKRIDIWLIISILGLSVISLFFIYSSSLDVAAKVISNEFSKQFVFLILGLGIFTAIHFIPIKYFATYNMYVYIVSISLLIITLLIGEVRNGAKSWIGIWGFGIQASEFMKITTIISLASILSEKSPDAHSYKNFVRYSIYVLIPIALILLQPDMGTALVYIPILLGMYFIYGVPPHRIAFIVAMGISTVLTLVISYSLITLRNISETEIELFKESAFSVYLLILVGICLMSLLGMATGYFSRMFKWISYTVSIFLSGGVLAYVASLVLKPYQIQRLLVFVKPESDPLGSGWHIIQSMTALGAGGIAGQGYLQGTQTKLEFLPQKSTDFIFSVIGEELGFLGTSLVIILYVILLWRILLIGIKTNDIFASLYCGGTAAMFFVHFLVNVGMTIGIMPVTGIPLLLLSYGGSSLLASLIGLAIIHSIHYHNSYKTNN